jgi:protein O-GlcNAc transferase
VDEAEASYERALDADFSYAQAHFELANLRAQLGRVEQAIEGYRRALVFQPEYPDAWSNLLLALHYSPDTTCELLWTEHRRFGQVLEEALPPRCQRP